MTQTKKIKRGLLFSKPLPGCINKQTGKTINLDPFWKHWLKILNSSLTGITVESGYTTDDGHSYRMYEWYF